MRLLDDVLDQIAKATHMAECNPSASFVMNAITSTAITVMNFGMENKNAKNF